MAQINATFDTETKKLVVTIDGKEVADVKGYSSYVSWDDDDDFTCNVMTMVEDEATNIKTSTQQLYASETVKAKAALTEKTGEESPVFPGFVVVKSTEDSQVHQDIASFFKK